ncbi:MAG: ROK family protein [Phycisphaeraceae bacterium]|nr:ROK family protein [Phycisphaeraceae bacterium]
MAVTKPFVGIDLGGTNMQIGVVGPGMKLLHHAKRKTKADEGTQAIIGRMISGIEEACAAAKVLPSDLGGVGIGAPGAVDPGRGVVVEAVNLRWDNFPLAETVAKRLKVPTFVDNDVNVAVLGEHRLGAGKGADDLLGVWVGTGIGGGLILGGRLFYGHFLTAGEIGHAILHAHHPRGQRSLEHNCSRTAMVDRLVRLIRANHKSRLTDELRQKAGDAEEIDYSKIKSKMLARYYRGGESEDALVIEVLDASAQDLGVMISNFVTVLSLPRVVVGGGLVEALGKPYVDRVERTVRELAFPEVCRKVEVVASKLADAAGIYGAAMIAMEHAGAAGLPKGRSEQRAR